MFLNKDFSCYELQQISLATLDFFLLQLTKTLIMQERTFELLVNRVPYEIKVTPYEFNTETRFRVSYNGGNEHVFTWDSRVGRLAAIDDDSATLPDDLEVAIAEKLQAGKF